MAKRIFLILILLFALAMPSALGVYSNVIINVSTMDAGEFTNEDCTFSGGNLVCGANELAFFVHGLHNSTSAGTNGSIEMRIKISTLGNTHFMSYGLHTNSSTATGNDVQSYRIIGDSSSNADIFNGTTFAVPGFAVGGFNLFEIRYNTTTSSFFINGTNQVTLNNRNGKPPAYWLFTCSGTCGFTVDWIVLSSAPAEADFFTSFAINNTAPLKNEFVNISVNVTATNTNISGYIFQWDNGTDNFINDSFVNIQSNNWSLANVSVTKQLEPSEGTIINYRWFFNTTDGVNHTSLNQTVLVENVSMDACGLNTVIAANFSFFDEDTNLPIKADADATFNWEFKNIKSETLNIDKTNVNDFQVCITPGRASFTVDYSIFYQNSTYPLRRNFVDGSVFNNQTKQIKLYLLDENEGIFAQFRVVDVQSNNLVSVLITAKTKVNNILTTVEIEQTDDSGLATFFVDPDKDYTFTFVKSGFQTITFTIRPTSSEIQTVTMGSTEPLGEISPIAGASYFFLPENIVLQNQTNVNFTFNLTSQFFNITSCSITVTNGTTTLGNSTGTFNASVCGAQVTVNTANHSTIISIGRYVLNATNTFNVSQIYNVKFTFIGSVSLQVLINDINAFAGSGFDNFTRSILGILFTFMIVGLASTGGRLLGSRVTDEVSLIILALASIWFFSYANWFNLPLTTFPDLPGIGLSKAFLQQWMVFIITSMGGIAHIISRRR